MAAQAGLCVIQKCEFSSCGNCHCCKKDLCIDHLKEHKDQLNAELIPLAHQINASIDDLQRCDPTSLAIFNVLVQWRIDAHKTIDQFYEHMLDELIEQRKNDSLKKLDAIRDNVDKLIRKQGATRQNIDLLNNDMRLIDEEIKSLKNKQIKLNPLVIDENLIVQSNFSNRKQKQNMDIIQSEFQASSNRNVFQIFVQLPTDKTILLTIDPTDTIRKIKEIITEREGIPTDQQYLTKMGKFLQDEHSIATYDIQRQSILKLSYRLKQQNEKN